MGEKSWMIKSTVKRKWLRSYNLQTHKAPPTAAAATAAYGGVKGGGGRHYGPEWRNLSKIGISI